MNSSSKLGLSGLITVGGFSLASCFLAEPQDNPKTSAPDKRAQAVQIAQEFPAEGEEVLPRAFNETEEQESNHLNFLNALKNFKTPKAKISKEDIPKIISPAETKKNFHKNLSKEFNKILDELANDEKMRQNLSSELKKLFKRISKEAQKQDLDKLNSRVKEFNTLFKRARDLPRASHREVNRLTGILNWSYIDGIGYLNILPPPPVDIND